MPILQKRKNLTPNNARASDVAARLTETLAPMHQQKMQAAFRVQGHTGTLYNKLNCGVVCQCLTKSQQVAGLSPDGKAASGVINRVLTGAQFGIESYDPLNGKGDNEEDYNTQFDDWGADFNGGELSGFTDRTLQPSDTNQDFNDGLDIEFGSLGLTDIACPVCFGSGYVGGFSVLKGFRIVVPAFQLETLSELDPLTFELSPGTHTFQTVLPLGVRRLEAFRVFNGRSRVPFEVLIDGLPAAGRAVQTYFDGRAHLITLSCSTKITHVEIQGSVGDSSVHFEFPKRAKSADLSMLERGEPFQVLLSPEIPHVDTGDVIVENGQGKVLVVQGVTPWKTKAQQNFGFEIQVRVAQPAELWYILPRTRTSNQPAVNMAAPSKSQNDSGLSFSF